MEKYILEVVEFVMLLVRQNKSEWIYYAMYVDKKYRQHRIGKAKRQAT
jgi:hypothetical protein